MVKHGYFHMVQHHIYLCSCLAIASALVCYRRVVVDSKLLIGGKRNRKKWSQRTEVTTFADLSLVRYTWTREHVLNSAQAKVPKIPHSSFVFSTLFRPIPGGKPLSRERAQPSPKVTQTAVETWVPNERISQWCSISGPCSKWTHLPSFVNEVVVF